MEVNLAPKNRVFLSLGSNLGDRFENLQKALELLNQFVGTIINVSSVYENPPLDFDSSDQFYNICLELETSLSISELLSKSQAIEQKIGRTEKTKKQYQSRLIDIDILYYNKEIHNEENITIPHLKLYERNFVLLPMCEISKEFVDPLKKETLKNLLKFSNDKSVLVQTTKRLKL